MTAIHSMIKSGILMALLFVCVEWMYPAQAIATDWDEIFQQCPQINPDHNDIPFCTSAMCGDYALPNGARDDCDFFALMLEIQNTAHYRSGNSVTNKNHCMDLFPDGKIDFEDAKVWWIKFLFFPQMNVEGSPCQWTDEDNALLIQIVRGGAGPRGLEQTEESQSRRGEVPDQFMISGSRLRAYGGFEDAIYTLGTNGACTGTTANPAGGAESFANGKLIKDSQGEVYQISWTRGLVRLSDNQTVALPNQLTFAGKTILLGAPFIDAVFNPNNDQELYAIPVYVKDPSSGVTYVSAAKLALTGGGNYNIVRLYGEESCSDPMYGPECIRMPFQEIEISKSGQKLFVTASQADTNLQELLVFNEQTGAEEQRVPLDGILDFSSSFTVSSVADKLYFSGFRNDETSSKATLLRFNFPEGNSLEAPVTLDISGMKNATSLTEDARNGTLWTFGYDTSGSGGNSQPAFVSIPANLSWPGIAAANPISCGDLALTNSAVLIPGSTPSVPPLTLVSAALNKIHGASAQALLIPLGNNSDGLRAIEPRTGGISPITLTFDRTTDLEAVSVSSSSAGVSASFNPEDQKVTVTGAGDGKCVVLTMEHVQNENNVLRVVPLTGDVDGNGLVNIVDLSTVKSNLFQPVTSANFRSDVNADGLINITDLSLVKSNLFKQAAVCTE